MSITIDVLVIGGGFAGVSAAQGLEKQGVLTLLVDKKDYFEVTYSTLRSIAFPSQTKNTARKKYSDFLTGQFEQSAVKSLDSKHAILENGTAVFFKRAIIASGTRYPTLSSAKSTSSISIDQRNTELHSKHQELLQANSVLIIGAGPVGVELAGEIAHAMPHIKITLVHASDTILNDYKEKTQKLALKQLRQLGVEVKLNARFTKNDHQYINMRTNEVINADLVFESTGAVANNEFLKGSLGQILNEQGFVSVDDHLRVQKCKNLFAIGDIADVGEGKLGYLANEQGKYLAKTIANCLKGIPAKPYKRHPLMVLVPIGRKRGVFQLPFAVTTLKYFVNLKQKDLFISKTYKGFGTKPDTF